LGKSPLPHTDPPSESTAHRETIEHHGIWQGEMYRYEVKHRWEAQSGRVMNLDSLVAYDGESARIAQAKVGNISDRKIDLTHGGPPHLLGMGKMGDLTMRKLLAWTPEDKSQRLHFNSAEYVTTELIGEEVRAGMRCLRIDCTLGFREHRMAYRIWIAPERNYLPFASSLYFREGDVYPVIATETEIGARSLPAFGRRSWLPQTPAA
jgi:hypothetical protein